MKLFRKEDIMEPAKYLTSFILFILLSVVSYSSEPPKCLLERQGDSITIGRTYKVLCINDFETEGVLIGQDSLTIKLKTEYKIFSLRRDQILAIGDPSEDLTMQNVLPQIEKGKLVRIELSDGTEYIGYIESTDSANYKFRTLSNISIEIPIKQVKTVENSGGEVVSGEFRIEDPNQSRLMLAPTARPLGQGNGYFSVSELFFPMITCGVTDFLDVSGGISLIPFAPEQLYYFNIKAIPFHRKNVSLAGGILYGNITSEGSSGAGIVYGLGTYGNPDLSLTMGLGYPFSGVGGSTNPLIMLGGEARVSNSIKFISENWIVMSSDVPPVLSLGVRFFGRKIAADFGLIYPLSASSDEGLSLIPWVGFAYNF